MYGTVARVRIKAGAEQAVLALSASYRQNPIPGQVAQYVYRMDADPQEFYLAIIFESKEAYWANAQSPEQQARFEQLMTLLEAEPEWHDGEIIES